jgi:hypothetical protein
MLVPVVVAAGLTPSPFLRGLLPGGGSVGALGALWLWVVQVTGTASLAMGELRRVVDRQRVAQAPPRGLAGGQPHHPDRR